jgi:hypothetical protein
VPFVPGPEPREVPPFPPFPEGELDEPEAGELGEWDWAEGWEAEAALVLRLMSSSKWDGSFRSRIPSGRT